MPVVQWVAHVIRATIWLALHLAIATGLFLLSAYFATLSGTDDRNGAYFFRIIASVWFYIAAWSWVVRGVFKRPARPSEKRKPTGGEVARGTLGCVANLIPIPIVFVLGGRLADWAWAGIAGTDTAHPARQASDRLLAFGVHALDNAATWVPWLVAGLVVYNIGMGILRARSRQGATSGRSVQDANRATLDKLKKKGGREILAPAGIPTARTVGAAHAGAHGPDMSRFEREAGGREDRVLGALQWSSSDRAWWAHPHDRAFKVQLDGDAEGPDPHALELARQVVQRNFEALLRASEAARPVAQGRGVGLPRFTIGAVRVGSGSSPKVTMHLRCDGDAGHDYVVVSADDLHTFTRA
jgi:hypothetical protein